MEMSCGFPIGRAISPSSCATSPATAPGGDGTTARSELGGLRRSAAIREALAREPAIAEPALLALAAQYGTRELRQALTVADAAKVLEMIRGTDSPAEPTAESVEAAIEAWPEALPAAASEARSKAALVLQLALRLSRPGMLRPVVTAAVE